MAVYRTLVALLALLLLATGVCAQWNRPAGVSGPSGIGGDGNGLEPGVTPYSSYLRLYLEVDCYDAERDDVDGSDPRYVVGTRKEYYNGASSPIYDYQENYPYGFVDASWPTVSPGISITGISFTNPKFIRYEGRPVEGGGCYAFGRNIHEEYYATVLHNTFDLFGWQQVPKSTFYYSVDWDNSSEQCANIGGAWLPDPGYDGYRCCGDDWIWLHNRPVNYSPRSYNARSSLAKQDLLCLHSNTDSDDEDYGFGIGGENDGDTYGFNFGTNSYYCENPPGHVAYDSALELDNEKETTYALSSTDNYFIGVGQGETDLGKWSDVNGENPRYCNAYFDNTAGAGIKFEWLTLNEAANRNQANCELFLGYNWTGSRCCGAPGNPESYNDAGLECDAQFRANQLTGSGGVSLSDITFQPRFDRLCKSKLTKNRACYNNRSVENNSITAYSDANTSLKNILNMDGALSVCQSPQMPTGFEVVGKCGFKGDFSTFAVCAYSNDSWYKKGDLVFYDVLGYRASSSYKTLDDIKASLHVSTLPAGVADLFGQDQECCLNNACWNGQRCVDTESNYELFNSQWDEFDGAVNENKDVYRCRNGTWYGPLTVQFDWDFDNEHPGFCIDSTQCYCKDGSCPEGTHTNGCTTKEGFYTGDHLCEDRQWTSRTKLLALELMQLAGTQPYTLFCDQYDKSINFFEPIKIAPERVNNFCAISYAGKTVLGVTFNSGGADPMDIDINTVLTDQNKGFATVILDDDIEDCNDAVTGSNMAGYGSFRHCDVANDKYWYNNKTQTLLYAKDGLSGTEFVQPTSGQELETLFASISGYVDANTASITIPNIETIKHVREYKRLYLSKEGTGTVFAVSEGRYDDDLNQVRHFLGASYTGIAGIDCASIRLAYPSADCGTIGSSTIVLAKNADENFKYWSDLTAKLRYR
jgi:hypothetical protein